MKKNCIECEHCKKLVGDQYQCLKKTVKGNVYGWIFNKQLASKQALCDENCTE